MDADWIDEDTILGAAEDAGYPVTPQQLERWYRAGLVQRPVQIHRNGHRGSISRYPSQAGDQLIEVARRHERIHRLATLRLDLWWDGHWVDRTKLRADLLKPVDKMAEQGRALLAEHPDVFDAADALVNGVSLRRLSPPLRLMVRRLRRNMSDLREVLYLIGLFALGGDYEPEPVPNDDGVPIGLLLAQATAIDRGKTDRPLGNEPWLSPDVDAVGVVREIAQKGGLRLDDLAWPVREASDAALDQARDDARAFDELAVIGRGFQLFAGPDMAGSASLATLAAQTPGDRTIMILAALVLRRAAGDAAIEALHELVERECDRYAAIVAMHEALPQHTSILRLDMQERLAALPLAQAHAVRGDLTRYLEEHPDVAAALESPAGAD